MSRASTVERLRRVVREVANVEVPFDDADLIESGVLDSLALVTLIAEIEQEFAVELPLSSLDLDNFRSLRSMAHFVANGKAATDGAAV
jgi:acyl carrier protein